MSDEPIVSGGGWRREPDSTPVYIWAISCLVLAFVCGVSAVIHDGALRWALAIAGVLLFVLAIVLGRIEKPIQIVDPPDAGEDPHNLYLASGSKNKKDGSQQSTGGDVERLHAPQR